MDESDIDILGQRLGQVLKKHIQTINDKEATSFSKEIHYCEVGGSTEIDNYGEIQEHTKIISFDLCQDDEIIQNGNIELNYTQANEEGKFPKLMDLIVKEPYFFNDLNLTKETTIQISNIVYSQSDILSFHTTITGQVIIDKHKVFNLQNFEQRIEF
jgi:hypothetical protein